MRGERPVRMEAAAVGVSHTFQVVTQTKWAAVSCLRYRCACRYCCLLHGLSESETLANLEVGEWVWVLYRHL